MASQPSANWTDFISAIRCDHLVLPIPSSAHIYKDTSQIPEGFTLCFVSSTALLGDVIKVIRTCGVCDAKLNNLLFCSPSDLPLSLSTPCLDSGK